MGQFSKKYRIFTQKMVTTLSKRWVWDPGSGIRDPGSGKSLFRIPDPGPGVKKAPDPRSRIPDPQHCPGYRHPGSVTLLYRADFRYKTKLSQAFSAHARRPGKRTVPCMRRKSMFSTPCRKAGLLPSAFFTSCAVASRLTETVTFFVKWGIFLIFSFKNCTLFQCCGFETKVSDPVSNPVSDSALS